MRLIDADELKKKLSDKDLITWTHEYGDAIPFDWAISAVDNAETVDAISRAALKQAIRKSMNDRYISWSKTVTVADIADLIFDVIDMAPNI